MAEQVHHNVVEKPQSTSGSPLVDAAANQSTTAPADRGTYTRDTTTSSDNILTSSSGTETPTTLSQLLAGQAEPEAAKDAAEPSAGNAADSAADGAAYNFSENDAPQVGAVSTESTNGLGEDASQGEGPADDRSTADLSVDASVNSDTDNSRLDSTGKEDINHHRTNSVKKPAIFSKVTATKNFLSKVTPTAPITAKIGEKASASSAVLQPSSRPRLVAKTGASLASLQKTRLGVESASGPDASKVWNKNRPTPQTAPRALTDEELKQQYGIHLATRLQSEENGKDSKWADIDDDEEDWAPEAVVWMDGTKSTLTPQDTVPTEPELKEQKPVAPQQPKPAEGVRPVLALKQRSDMKILKPGNASSQANPAGPSASSPALDKAGLKTKSPAPAPTKSPWAPVPKVESISPINPPVQQIQAPLRLATQDARAYEPSQALPAREIAADTFDRSWKEGEGGTRELFNSTNGRYEPAPEGRRGSMKPDNAHRKPAVLQRPSHSAASPAEPSAAFQSRTSTQAEGSWGRRRGSSVSQGSLPSVRRMSMNQRPDLAQTPEVLQDGTVATNATEDSGQPAFSQQTAWDRQMPARPESGAESGAPTEQGEAAEDPLQVQERVMREKRELARKRRQEEEQRAEAEKQERLKAKLAELAGVGKSKKEREAEAAAAVAAAALSSSSKDAATAPAAAVDSATKQTPQAVQQVEAGKLAIAEKSATTAPAAKPQSRSSMPSQTQAVAPLAVNPLPPSIPLESSATSLPDRSLSSEQIPRQQTQNQRLSPRANARAPYQPPGAPYNKTPATSSYSSPGDRKLQPSGFERSPNLSSDTFTPWPTTAPNRNVWGTAGIGNGTFESASAFAPVLMAQQNSPLPPPPGMARPSTSARISPLNQEARSPNLQQQQISEQQRAHPPPGIEPRPETFTANQPRLNGISPAPGAGRPHPPGPIGPPSRIQAQTQPLPTQRSDPLSSWGTAAVNLPAKYVADAGTADTKRKQNIDAPAQSSDGRYIETFKKTSAEQGKLGGPRRYETTEYNVHDAQGSRSVASLSPAPPATQTQPSASFPASSPAKGSWRHASDSTVRIPDPSRNPAHGGTAARQAPIGPPGIHQQSSGRFPSMPIAPITESKDQSPPPPEMDSHPVNLGVNTNHPNVKLPRPQAKVRLPPVSPTAAGDMSGPYHDSVLMPPSQRPAVWGPAGPQRPLVMNEAWQARFNGLFNRTAVQTETPPSPPKTPPKMQGPLLAVASSSRIVMDEQAAGATVSLPVAGKSFEDTASNAIDTKPNIDEMFREELSFGSKPRVRIPRNTKYNTQPYADKQQYSNSQLRARLMVQSGQEPFFWQHAEGYFVAIRGTRLNNKLCRKASAVDSRTKIGERKPSQQQIDGKSWAERKASQTENNRSGQSGANSKSWHDDRSAQLQNANKEWSDRKIKPGKNKASSKDSEASPTPAAVDATTTDDSVKQSKYQKPSRQPRTAPSGSNESKAKGDDASKNDTGGDKKKVGWTNRGTRNNRNTGTASPAPPATASTTVKSG